jgi:hypothetical protein
MRASTPILLPARCAGSHCHRTRTLWSSKLIAGLLGCVLVLASIVPAAAGSPRESSKPIGLVARTFTLSEKSRLHLVSHQGTQILNERGVSSGTLSGPLKVTLRIYYTTATLTFTAYPKGGTFSGRGEGSYYVEGHVGHFNGTTMVTNGTGSYAHAAGSLHATGVILRQHYELLFTVAGTMKV